MKNIFKSLVIVLAVAAVAGGASYAVFSDEETLDNNSFAAGTLGITVDETEPWSEAASYDFSGLQPGDEVDIDVPVENVGSLPLVLWKKISVSDSDKNLEEAMNYSMTTDDGTVIDPTWNVTVADVHDLWIPLGRLNSGEILNVDQDYLFNESAGNDYQGASFDLEVTFYAEQINAPGPEHTTRGVVLENKNASGDWEPIVGDGTWGILTWDGSGNYELRAWGLESEDYYLVYYDEGSSSQSEISDLGSVTGSVSDSGNYPGFTSNTDAKYWVKTEDNNKTLWESNLVN